MSDGPGSGRNYWERASKELEEEKQMLLQQVTALTTERDNLAALVGEQRTALHDWPCAICRGSGQAWVPDGNGEGDSHLEVCWACKGSKLDSIAAAILARSPEQAGARVKAEREMLDASMDYFGKAEDFMGWEEVWNVHFAQLKRVMDARVALAAMEVKHAE